MPLTRHDQEEQARSLEGRVYDAREKVSETYASALEGPANAEAHMAAQRELNNRQSELIALLKEQLRQALS